jgi:hypothetical protein
MATGKPLKLELEDDGALVFVGWMPGGRIVSKTYSDGVKIWDRAAGTATVVREPIERPLVRVGKDRYSAQTALTFDGRVLAFRDCYHEGDVNLVDLSRYLDAAD